METLTVSSWSDIQEVLFADSWVPEIGRFRSRYAFRGLSDADHRLETTLMRLGGSYAQLERHLLRNFRKYAHRRVVERDSVWHWLAVAQHYGLPTRLLDWTYSPFVALHFATAHIDTMDRDGAIWAVNYLDAHRMAPYWMSSAQPRRPHPWRSGESTSATKILPHEVTNLVRRKTDRTSC